MTPDLIPGVPNAFGDVAHYFLDYLVLGLIVNAGRLVFVDVVAGTHYDVEVGGTGYTGQAEGVALDPDAGGIDDGPATGPPEAGCFRYGSVFVQKLHVVLVAAIVVADPPEVIHGDGLVGEGVAGGVVGGLEGGAEIDQQVFVGEGDSELIRGYGTQNGLSFSGES